MDSNWIRRQEAERGPLAGLLPADDLVHWSRFDSWAFEQAAIRADWAWKRANRKQAICGRERMESADRAV